MSDIFISHVEADAQIALETALGLEEAGYTTWCYQIDSVPGLSYLIQTGQAIEQAKAVLLVISSSSLASHQITREVVRAHESGKHFLPLLRDVTHIEFTQRQPEWREAMGAATSMRIPSEGIVGIIPRVIAGLKALGIYPKQKPDKARIGLIKDELGRAEPTAETLVDVKAAPSVKPSKKTKGLRLNKPTIIGISSAVFIAIVIVTVIGLKGGLGNLGKGTGPLPTSSTATPTQPTPPLKIGQLNSLTGVLRDFGEAHRKSAILAVDHVNQAGGVLGSVVTIVVRDTGTNPVQGVDAARALVDIDNVAVILGALSSGVTIAVANSVTVPNSILQITAASTSTGVSVLEDNDFLFRTTVGDKAQGAVLARLALELDYQTASALYVNNVYGQCLATAFETDYEAAGGTVLELVPHEMMQPTYASELSRATEGDPDVLLALSYPESAETYLREAIEGGLIDTFLFCDGTKSPDMNEAVGVEHLEGTYGTVAGARVTQVQLDFEEMWVAAWGEASYLPYRDTTYDAVVLIALAAEKAGTTTDSAAIRDALRDVANPPGEVVGPGVDDIKRALELIQDGEDINYEGAGGSQDFDANGDVLSTIEIWKIENGEIVSTGRYELP